MHTWRERILGYTPGPQTDKFAAMMEKKQLKELRLLMMPGQQEFEVTINSFSLKDWKVGVSYSGTRIVGIVPGGAAEAAGLQVGMTLLSVDVKRVRTQDDVTDAMTALRRRSASRRTAQCDDDSATPASNPPQPSTMLCFNSELTFRS